MKLGIVIELIVCATLLCGCEENTQQKPLDKSAINAELINALNDTAMQNAIISQHTVFPYHFVNNSQELNELGQRDLAVLAQHFTANPGKLNIRRGDISEQLYQERISYVIDQLQQHGVDAARIEISDGMAGGAGMPSERVLTILEQKERPARSSSGRTSLESR